MSVIVTAEDLSETAATAVEAIGGRGYHRFVADQGRGRHPTGEPTGCLAATPGLVSIVSNKGVKSAQDPVEEWDGWVTDYRFPVPWDGSPDVQATSNRWMYEMVYPTVIDVGADVYQTVHIHRHSPGQPIDGTGVTIAVVDSGVYFSDEVKKTSARGSTYQFQGQADFVGNGLAPKSERTDTRISIIQQDGYCWTDFQKSRDPYGHGTHVAGIIWNNFHDDATWIGWALPAEANILSVRVLGDDGIGTYEDVIQGIQYVVENKDTLGIRVLNMSLSAYVTSPYFADPLNRAVEAAWANGIVVVAAAGNEGPGAESITVPGNDPYVITVGAVDSKRTPGYWDDDFLPGWSATGPTWDGFAKPDVLAPGANIVSFMYNDHDNVGQLVRIGAGASRLFRNSRPVPDERHQYGYSSHFRRGRPDPAGPPGVDPGPGQIPADGFWPGRRSPPTRWKKIWFTTFSSRGRAASGRPKPSLATSSRKVTATRVWIFWATWPTAWAGSI